MFVSFEIKWDMMKILCKLVIFVVDCSGSMSG